MRGGTDGVQLRRDDRPDKPVAAYHKEKRLLHVLRMSQYPYLEVDRDPAVIETLDYVVGEYSAAVITRRYSLISWHTPSFLPASGATSQRLRM